MNSVFSSHSLFVSLPRCQFLPCIQTQPQHMVMNRVYRWNHCVSPLSVSFPFISHHSLHTRRTLFGATAPSNEGVVSVINFDDFDEKDWSFLDSGDFSSDQDYNLKIDRLISAGEIEETSRVMVSIGSEGFVDRLVESSPCIHLLVVHDEVFKTLGRCFTPGARLVISHPQGREVLERQRRQYPDVITSDLPEKSTLEEAAAEHSFKLTEFLDEPGFYLAVLKFVGARN